MGANAQTSVPTFTAGEVLTAANMNISARTGIPVFADTTARDAAFGGTGEKTLAEGQFAYIEATNSTQYYDGAAWVAVGASGLSLLNTTTFTASSAVNVSNVMLAATATNYFVVVNCVGSANVGLNMRFRENVTDKATGYAVGNLNINVGVGTITQLGGDPLTTMRIGVIDSSAATDVTTVFMNISLTNGGTTGVLTFNGFDVSNSAVQYGGGVNVNCTAITGFSLIPASGNITGTVRTYSYANS
jgi:hypothetical protein